MAVRTLSLLALCLVFPAETWASALTEAAKRLDGAWRGDGYSLTIDSQRDQAQIDPKRPFEWQRFLVKEVRSSEIVFTIGAEIYEARLDAGQLSLTGTGFRGEHKLRRQAAPPALGMEMRGTLPPGAPVVLSGTE